jgi:hypothetical protein
MGVDGGSMINEDRIKAIEKQFAILVTGGGSEIRGMADVLRYVNKWSMIPVGEIDLQEINAITEWHDQTNHRPQPDYLIFGKLAGLGSLVSVEEDSWY